MARATASERSMRATLASYTSWANTADPVARTEPARQTFIESFASQVDPDGTLPPAERARRAEAAHKAHMMRLALRSAQSRRRAAERRAGERRAAAP